MQRQRESTGEYGGGSQAVHLVHGGPRVVCVGRVVKGTSCGVPVDVASQRRVILPGTASVSQRALYANQMASSASARD